MKRARSGAGFWVGLTCLVVTAGPAADGAVFYLSEQTELIVPEGRGTANSVYYGWDTFNEPGSRDLPNAIDDSTPELGVNPGAGRIVTNNGEDHVSNASGNYYSGTGQVDETVTVDAAGTIGSGFTTIVAQGITLFGGFGAPIQVSAINGVVPTVVQGLNAFGGGGANAKEQFWAIWEIPGHVDTYQFTITTDPAANGGGGSFVSLDRLVVDAWWTAGAPDNDQVFAAPVPEPGLAGFLAVSASLIFSRRRRGATRS